MTLLARNVWMNCFGNSFCSFNFGGRRFYELLAYAGHMMFLAERVETLQWNSMSSVGSHCRVPTFCPRKFISCHQHRHLLHEVVDADGTIRVVMERITRTLQMTTKKWLERTQIDKPIVLQEVCKALSYLYELNVAYYDVRLRNVFHCVDEGGLVVVENLGDKRCSRRVHCEWQRRRYDIAFIHCLLELLGTFHQRWWEGQGHKVFIWRSIRRYWSTGSLFAWYFQYQNFQRWLWMTLWSFGKAMD